MIRFATNLLWAFALAAYVVEPVSVFAEEDEPTAEVAKDPSEAVDARAHDKADPTHDKDDHGKADHKHAHDDTDLGHGDASASQTKPEAVQFDLALGSLIVFLLLLAVLTKFAWGPISHGLEAREHSIAEMIENAKKDAEKAAENLRVYEQKLAAAADEARNLIGEARKEAERAREQIVAEAKSAAQHEKEKAIADIRLAKQDALQAIAQKSVDTAIRLAGNIVQREIKPADHEHLIAQALKELPSVN